MFRDTIQSLKKKFLPKQSPPNQEIQSQSELITVKEQFYNNFKNKYNNEETITNEDMNKLIAYADDFTASINIPNTLDINKKYPIIYLNYNRSHRFLIQILRMFIFNEDINSDDKFILAPILAPILSKITEYFMLNITISLYVIRFYKIRSLYLHEITDEMTDYISIMNNISKLSQILIFICVIINDDNRKTNKYNDLVKDMLNINDFSKKLNYETYMELCTASLAANNTLFTLYEKYKNLEKILKELGQTTTGGGNKFKSTKNKITVIYKKKQYTRVIYISERKKYVKINKTYLLLSKLQKI
jgi:hypothetical protein